MHGPPQFPRENQGVRSSQHVHVLIHVERIGLLRKIVRANRATHLGRFIL